MDGKLQQEGREAVRSTATGCAGPVDLLTAELELLGPNRYNWNNYSKLTGTIQRYHCHVKKGKPTYVAVWEVVDDRVRLLEVTYAGTHEKAPY